MKQKILSLLLLIGLATSNAWATVIDYVAADGTNQSVDATEITLLGGGSELATASTGAWFYLADGTNADMTSNIVIPQNVTVNIIIPDGVTRKFQSTSEYGRLVIELYGTSTINFYGQTAQTGTVEFENIMLINGNLNVYGGNIKTTGNFDVGVFVFDMNITAGTLSTNTTGSANNSIAVFGTATLSLTGAGRITAKKYQTEGTGKYVVGSTPITDGTNTYAASYEFTPAQLTALGGTSLMGKSVVNYVAADGTNQSVGATEITLADVVTQLAAAKDNQWFYLAGGTNADMTSDIVIPEGITVNIIIPDGVTRKFQGTTEETGRIGISGPSTSTINFYGQTAQTGTVEFDAIPLSNGTLNIYGGNIKTTRDTYVAVSVNDMNITAGTLSTKIGSDNNRLVVNGTATLSLTGAGRITAKEYRTTGTAKYVVGSTPITDGTNTYDAGHTFTSDELTALAGKSLMAESGKSVVKFAYSGTILGTTTPSIIKSINGTAIASIPATGLELSGNAGLTIVFNDGFVPKQATFTCNDGSTTTLLTPSTVIDAPSFTTTETFDETEGKTYTITLTNYTAHTYTLPTSSTTAPFMNTSTGAEITPVFLITDGVTGTKVAITDALFTIGGTAAATEAGDYSETVTNSLAGSPYYSAAPTTGTIYWTIAEPYKVKYVYNDKTTYAWSGTSAWGDTFSKATIEEALNTCNGSPITVTSLALASAVDGISVNELEKSFTVAKPFNEATINVNGTTDKLTVSLYHTTHHMSTTDYDYDADKHWFACDKTSLNCDYEPTDGAKQAHSFDSDNKCYCGYEKYVAPTHTHSWPADGSDDAKVWKNNATHHWHLCLNDDPKALCDLPEDATTTPWTDELRTAAKYAEHKYATGTDAIFSTGYYTCEDCGYENADKKEVYEKRNVHTLAAAWTYETDNTKPNYGYHWHACSVTGCTLDFANLTDADKTAISYGEHEYGLSGSAAYTCKTCGFEDPTKKPHAEHSYNTAVWMSDNDTHWHPCTQTSPTAICEAPKGSEAAHTYTSSDPTKPEFYTCSICGKENTAKKAVAESKAFAWSWTYDIPYEFNVAQIVNDRVMTPASNGKQAYTICLPYSVTLPETVEVYTLGASKDNQVGFVKLESNVLEAHKPYLIIPTASGQLLSTNDGVVKVTNQGLVEAKDVTSAAVSGQTRYTLKGSMSYKDGPAEAENTYILQSQNQWLQTKGGKYTNTGDGANKASILPMRAYIVAAGAAPSRLFSFFDATTGIQRTVILNADSQPVYYDLQGRRVKNPVKGNIYIVNGKKMLMK